MQFITTLGVGIFMWVSIRLTLACQVHYNYRRKGQSVVMANKNWLQLFWNKTTLRYENEIDFYKIEIGIESGQLKERGLISVNALHELYLIQAEYMDFNQTYIVMPQTGTIYDLEYFVNAVDNL